jgi:hypothetical protein
MLTHTSRWSHARGNEVVPSRWQTTHGDYSSVRPLVPGTRMAYSPPPLGEYVIMTLHPTRPGKVRVNRVDLEYGYGRKQLLHRGTDPVSMDITVRSR